ncbi:MAG: hypothetical protein HKN08_01470, partial [Gammaproteobacteria bacterium]|nr:hypothetical protein [Gammaproteobacteria bacterium]
GGSQDPSGIKFRRGFGGNVVRSAIFDASDTEFYDDCIELDDQFDEFTAFRDVYVDCAGNPAEADTILTIPGFALEVGGEEEELVKAINSGTGVDENNTIISADRVDFTVGGGTFNAATLSLDAGVAPDAAGTLPDPVNGTAIGNYFGAVDPASGNPDMDPNNNGGGGGPFWDGWTYINSAVEGGLPGSNFHPLAAELEAGGAQ